VLRGTGPAPPDASLRARGPLAATRGRTPACAWSNRPRSARAAGPGIAPVANPGPAWARRYRRRLLATDVLIIAVAVAVAFATRFWWTDPRGELTSMASDYLVMTGAIIALWIAALGAGHTRDARVVGMGIAEYRRIVNASVVSFGLLAIVLLVLEVDIARGYFIVALPLGLGGLLVGRLLWRKWLVRRRREGDYTSRVLVVGDGPDVEYVIRQVKRQGVSPYAVVGAAVSGCPTGAIRVGDTEVPIVSGLDAVAEAAAVMDVDAVIVAGQPQGGGDFIRDLGWNLERTSAELVVASRLTNVAGPRIHFRPVEGLPLMHVELPQYEGGKHVLKRALDIAAACVALVVLMPLMMLVALLVRLDSPGPVLFRQERVGRGARPFSMLKFRSMVEGAEDDLAGLLDGDEGAGVLFKMRDDPRITPIGAVLRKYSLDELPQLWNILRGEMSLVGPRPPLAREVAGYEDHVHRRLYIKPGLTGMWQVNGRSDLDWDESVRLDLYYVENWSLTGDLVILWRTVKVLLRPVGAY
jgi:exopolysaccharide biosynthesis polyprenyl glycosylphosphotransferase